jgi:16S rRNA (guanine966-N2)-methyltransferase
VPTARIIEANIRTLGVEDRASLVITSAFLWAKRDLISQQAGPPLDRPWLVFCSPPYAFYQERQVDMIDVIQRIQSHAPPGSILIVESNEPFDAKLLPASEADVGGWDFRSYPPAVVGLWRDRRSM